MENYYTSKIAFYIEVYLDGLVQERHNSSA